MTRAIGAAGFTALLLLVVAQLALPGIAADRLRSSLSRHATGVRVAISAFPAIELLWGQASSVDVQMNTMRSGAPHAGSLLAQTANVGSLHVRIGRDDVHGLILTEVRVEKVGQRLTASARITRAAIESVLPVEMTLASRPAGAMGIPIDARVTILGKHLSTTLDVAADRGKIVLHPLLVGVGSLLNSLDVTLFNVPSLDVLSVSARWDGHTYQLAAASTYR